jgi:hypothetical protein
MAVAALAQIVIWRSVFVVTHLTVDKTCVVEAYLAPVGNAEMAALTLSWIVLRRPVCGVAASAIGNVGVVERCTLKSDCAVAQFALVSKRPAVEIGMAGRTRSRCPLFLVLWVTGVTPR